KQAVEKEYMREAFTGPGLTRVRRDGCDASGQFLRPLLHDADAGPVGVVARRHLGAVMRPDIGAALSDASLERNAHAAAWRSEPPPCRRILPVSLVPHVVLGGRRCGNERGARNQPKPHRNGPDDASHPATPFRAA